MAHYDDIKTQNVAIVGLIGAIVTFAIIVFLTALYRGAQQRQEVIKDIDQAPVEYQDLVASQQALLNNYRWIKEVQQDGKTRQVYAVPIERAMTLVEEELAARRPGFEYVAPPTPPAKPSGEPTAKDGSPIKGGKEDAKP